VLLIRPCAGDEPHLERALVSLRSAFCGSRVRCRFAIADAADAALPAARRACEALGSAGIDAEISITGAAGPNRKAAQIEAVVALAHAHEGDVNGPILIADSDVDLAGVDLDALINPLTSGGADAVWTPPVERDAVRTFGDRASVALLAGSLHAFPLLAALDERGLVGKLFSIRGDVLRAVGGFASLTQILGEDIEIARRVRARGGSIRVTPFAVRSLATGRSFGQVVQRYARWLVIIRAQRPWLLLSYPALFFASPLLLALSAVAAPFAPIPAITAALLTIAARLSIAAGAARAAGRKITLSAALTDAALADVLLACAFVCALRTRTVVWRSTVLTVDRSGVLRERAV
jgi:ceramide glucosyltransferase